MISQIENEMFRTSDELYLSMLYILITFLFYCTKCATIPFIACQASVGAPRTAFRACHVTPCRHELMLLCWS